jgi:hypothetical protein
MFEEQYCQFAPQGAQAKLWFNPSFIRKNQKASETNAPLVISAIPTGQSQFGHTNCPVRALRLYRRRTTDQGIRKGRKHLFIPIKDVKPGVEVSGATISRWICIAITTAPEGQHMVPPSGVKADEVRAVSTSLCFFTSTPLSQVLEASHWHSGGTFSQFYLRDLAPQEWSIRSAGSVVAAGQVVTLPS